jgi:hypothetical protein
MKATKKTASVTPASVAAETPKATAETPTIDPASVTLTGPQVEAVKALETAARGVEASKRDAAMAIYAAQRAGVPTAYGLSLSTWVVRHLTGIGIPKATAYYLADIGQGYATLGTERADLFPMEGLRTIVATAKRRNKGDDKGAAAAIRDMANTAQDGDTKAAPSLKGCRKASAGEEPVNPAERIEASVAKLTRWAISEAGDGDLLVALDLLKRAAVRVDAMEKARQKAEAAKA